MQNFTDENSLFIFRFCFSPFFVMIKSTSHYETNVLVFCEPVQQVITYHNQVT
jgi:hypothetical protein